MKRKFVLIVLALVLAFGAVSVVNAKVIAASINTNRTSNTSATVSASGDFDGIKDSCTCKITLQEKYNGSWRKATGVTKKTASLTEKNTISLLFSTKFTLIKGKVYRVKVTFTDKKGTRSTSSTYYSGSF
ncbi:hypothetical protein [Zhenpiania hominis]|uniref:Uncharacterized protein n=1 Tax=Zhenpiania hominis TaxID=2763644 RepID=A0A923SWB3_9FIRM|nr:hypothetical protein [Zhenpiania hominis]MBC6680173.1 hypothetical protein [Zhenpiania hominis]